MPDGHSKLAPVETSLEPEAFLRAYRNIGDKKQVRDQADADWKAQFEKAKSSGFDTAAIKLAIKLKKMDPAKAKDLLLKTVTYLRLLGVTILDQQEMFDTPVSGLTEGLLATHAAWESEKDGYAAGKRGDPVDANPKLPGTAEHQAWAQGWYDSRDDQERLKEEKEGDGEEGV